MTRRFFAPPNWPSMPKDWQPYSGWNPDPAWGQAPYQWEFWREEDDDPDLAHRGSAYYALFALALSICTVLGVALSKIGKVFDEDILAMLGVAPMALTTKLHKRLVARLTHQTKNEVDLAAGFGKPWPIVLVIGSIFYFLSLQVAGLVMGFAASSQRMNAADFMPIAVAGVVLASLASLPLLGFASGLRAERGAYLLPSLMTLFGSLLGLITTKIMLVTNDSVLQYLDNTLVLDLQTSLTILAQYLVLGALLGIPFVYLGRQHRRSQYAAWLVRRTDQLDG